MALGEYWLGARSRRVASPRTAPSLLTGHTSKFRARPTQGGARRFLLARGLWSAPPGGFGRPTGAGHAGVFGRHCRSDIDFCALDHAVRRGLGANFSKTDRRVVSAPRRRFRPGDRGGPSDVVLLPWTGHLESRLGLQVRYGNHRRQNPMREPTTDHSVVGNPVHECTEVPARRDGRSTALTSRLESAPPTTPESLTKLDEGLGGGSGSKCAR